MAERFRSNKFYKKICNYFKRKNIIHVKNFILSFNYKLQFIMYDKIIKFYDNYFKNYINNNSWLNNSILHVKHLF